MRAVLPVYIVLLANPQTAFHRAVLSQPTQEGHTALWVAGTRSKLEVLKALLAAGAKKEAKAQVCVGVG